VIVCLILNPFTKRFNENIQKLKIKFRVKEKVGIHVFHPLFMFFMRYFVFLFFKSSLVLATSVLAVVTHVLALAVVTWNSVLTLDFLMQQRDLIMQPLNLTSLLLTKLLLCQLTLSLLTLLLLPTLILPTLLATQSLLYRSRLQLVVASVPATSVLSM
jgi:hypothetical protein